MSLICLVSGATLTTAAPDRPVPQAAYESMGGSLIVGDLCLLGFGLSAYL
ncbi:hypothetical protein [Methylorubrum extorquens]